MIGFIEWPAHLSSGLLSAAIFGLLGIVIVFGTVRFWDKVTPGNLEEEVFVKGNIAAAIFGSSLVIGLSLIVAAAIRG